MFKNFKFLGIESKVKKVGLTDKEYRQFRKGSFKLNIPLKRLFEASTEKLKKRIENVLLSEEPRILEGDSPKSKGWLGTGLPLIPNISKSEVEVGTLSNVLELFGLKRREGTRVILYHGPNGRSNRYLRFQYQRLVFSIGGRIRGKTVSWTKVWKNIPRDRKIDGRTRSQRRADAKSVRTFWAVGLNLVVNSRAFRIALFNQTLGRTGRWFHRDHFINDLVRFNESYLKIAKGWRQQIPVQRCLIPQGPTKWRPLGVAPVAWRVYTGGLAKVLALFMANGASANQYAYTTGRGVDLAWNFILTKVIKAKFIYEFDLIGYFNNISHKSVVHALHRFHLPKYVTIHFMNLSCSDIRNITNSDMLKKTATSDSTWSAHWRKHEYIHKYREGWRSRGFAQGFSLSPILSILPIIWLEELEKLGVSAVVYADDGLLFGDVDLDYQKLAQQAFEKGETGVKVHLDKSRWVKQNGIWLEKLKFVGCLYDPFRNVFSACTRNGATLPMEISLFGLVSHKSVLDQRLEKAVLEGRLEEPNFMFSEISPIPVSGPLKLEVFNYHYENFLRSLLYVWEDNPDSEGFERALAGNASYVWTHYELMELWDKEKAIGILEELEDIVPSRLVLENLKDVALSVYRSKLKSHSLAEIEVLNPAVRDSELLLNIKLLSWYRNTSKTAFSQKGLELEGLMDLLGHDPTGGVGGFQTVRIHSKDSPSVGYLPADAFFQAMKENWEVTLIVSRICWESLVDHKLFATFIARMFNNSYSQPKTVQDFSLGYAEFSLQSYISSHISRREWASLLHNHGIDVFNSTSIASFYLADLMKHWDKASKLDKFVDPNALWRPTYESFWDKLATRRAGGPVDESRLKATLKDVDINTAFYMSLAAVNGIEDYAGKAKTSIIKYPLDPACIEPLSERVKARVQRKISRLRRGGIGFDVLSRSMFSEFERFYKQHENHMRPTFIEYRHFGEPPVVEKPKRTDWLTWPPYTKGPRKLLTPRPSPVKRKLRITRYWYGASSN
jgi:hypothetical protein